MKEHPIDRTGWPQGPWTHEPDREQWRTEAGLPGLIVRNHSGALCGYAAVDSDHPFYGADYEQVPVDVHGGLTYAARCRDETPICHIAEPGEPDDVWWLGFDCAHAGDLLPGHIAHGGTSYALHALDHDTYRDRAYVRAEVENLARQLVAQDRPAGDSSSAAEIDTSPAGHPAAKE